MPLPAAAAQRVLRGRQWQAGARRHCHGHFDWALIAFAIRVLHDLHRGVR